MKFLGHNPTNIYKNPKGPIFVTVGTGGAHDMTLSSLDDFAAEGVDVNLEYLILH